jgi:thiamine-phosphate pyrophosphorylase
MSFRLIVITPPATLKNEVDLVEQLFKNGLQTLHVRKPGMSRSAFRAYLGQFRQQHHRRMVIHSHYSLLHEFSLKGAHLTEKSRRRPLPAAYRPKLHTLSASIHSVEELNRLRRKYDYIFLSPVFNSISKKGYESSFTETELLAACSGEAKVIALGGTSPATISRLQKMNFAGAAALGFIWENSEPLLAYRKLVSKIK